MMIGANQAALQQTEVAFHGVGVNDQTINLIALASVLFADVVGRFMRDKFRSNLLVVARAVAHQVSVFRDLREQNRLQVAMVHVRNVEPTRRAVALNESKDLELVRVTALGALHALDVAVEGLVRLKNPTATTEQRAIVLHRFANAMGHEPCALESNAKGAMQLVRANAFLARRHKEHRLQPVAQLDMARLKDGADLDGKGLAAVFALPQTNASAFALKLVVRAYDATMRAYRTIGPQVRFNELVRCFFVVKVRSGKDRFGHECFLERWKHFARTTWVCQV